MRSGCFIRKVKSLTDNTERTQVGWRFWLLWVLASSLGFVVGIFWAEDVATAVHEATIGIEGGRPGAFGWGLMAAFIGASIGTAQWFVLRRQVAQAGWWVLASALGGFVGGILLREASLLLLGVSLGIAQGIVLYIWRGSPALLWVLASTVAISLAFVAHGVVSNIALEVAMAGAERTPSEAGTFFGTFGSTYRLPLTMLEGFVYGAISGVVVVWLMRLPAKKNFRHPQDTAAAEGESKPNAEELRASLDDAEPQGKGQLITEEPSLHQDAADLEADGKELPGTIERPQVGWRFWLAWLVASIVGLVAGGFLPFTWPFASAISEASSARLWIALGGALVGASLGIAQALPLQWRKVDWSGWWAMGTTIGMSVGWVVASSTGGVLTLGALQKASVDLAAAVVVVGVSLGIAQWPVLRGRVPRASWWVLASIVGSLASAAALVVVWENPFETNLPSRLYFEVMTTALNGLVPMALYVATTGVVMVWLLRQPVKEQTSLPGGATEPKLGRVKWGVWAAMSVGALALALLSLFQSRPRLQARQHFNRGRQAASESPELAIEEYTNAIAIDPEYSTAYERRGILYGSIGEVDLAIADFEQAIALDPESVYAYSNLGDLYARKGEFEQAIAHIGRAMELNQIVETGFYAEGILEDQLERLETMRERATTPTGWLEAANCQQIAGWAWDPKTPNQSIGIEIYDLSDDGTETLLLPTVAGLYRPDLPPVLGDNGMHGFVIATLSALRDGSSHTVRVYAVNSDARFPNRILNGSDVQVRCP